MRKFNRNPQSFSSQSASSASSANISRGKRRHRGQSGGKPAANRAFSSRPSRSKLHDIYEQQESETERDQMARQSMSENEEEYRANFSEEDEDLDEDAAFDSADEEKWGEHFLKKGKGKSTKESTISLKEQLSDQDENHNDTEPSDFEQDPDAVDLSEMFGDAPVNEPAAPSVDRKAFDPSLLLDGLDGERGSSSEGEAFPSSEEEEEEEEDDNENDDAQVTAEQSDESDGSQDEADFSAFVDNLDTIMQSKKEKKTKASKIYGQEMMVEESEFAVPTTRKQLVSMDSLMGSLLPKDTPDDEPLPESLSTLQKQMRLLAKEKSGQKVVNTPLPLTTQRRMDRQVGYETTSKEVSKWVPIVQKNRQADHLSFPLNEGKVNLTNDALRSKFEAANDFEKEVEAVLKSAGMASEKQILEQETLAMNALDPEEVKAQQAELAKMRALLFYAEQKEKRASKIKSKKYRKIRKKEKERHQEQLSLEQMDEADPEAADEERMKLERARAEERMSLRHKKGSKWARQLMKSEEMSEETREALIESHRRHDQLTRRIEGRKDSDEDSYSSDASSDNDSQAMQSIVNELSAPVDESSSNPTKGVFAMKFMRDAMEQQRKESLKRVQEMQKEFEQDYSMDQASQPPINLPNRMSFQGKDTKSSSSKSSGQNHLSELNKEDEGYYDRTSEKEESESETQAPNIHTKNHQANTKTHQTKASAVKSKITKINSEQKSESKPDTPAGNMDQSESVAPPLKPENPFLSDLSDLKETNDDTAADMQNPWLLPIEAEERTLVAGRVPDRAKSSDHGRAVKLGNKIRKTLNKANKKTSGNSDYEDHVEVGAKRMIDNSDDDDDQPSEQEAEDMVIPKPKKKIDFLSQRELIQLAFASDHVVEKEFKKEKKAQVKEDAPQEQDLTLPGWGSWSDNKRPAKRRFIQKLAGIDPSKRQDKSLNHVIINEKRDKKLVSKYKTTEIPFPYQSKEQYEAMMRNPAGKEWNTELMHREFVKPRITTKAGKVIHPIKK